jgi:hypothetical protein
MLLCSVHQKILLAVILEHKLFQMCLFKAVSLRLALWAQLVFLELPSKIFLEPKQTHIFPFGYLTVNLNYPHVASIFIFRIASQYM